MVVRVALAAVALIHQRVIRIQPIILIGLTIVAGLRFTLAAVGQELALLHIGGRHLMAITEEARFSMALFKNVVRFLVFNLA